MFNLNRKTKTLFLLLPISALLILLLSLSTPLKKTPKPTKTPPLHFHKHMQIPHSTCESTLYPELCVSTLSSFPHLASQSIPQIISSSVNHTIDEVKISASNCTGIRKKLRSLDPVSKMALDDCLELFDETIDELQTALFDLSPKSSPSKHYHDLQTLFSAAITNQYTCLDGFEYSKGSSVRNSIEENLYEITQLVSNSLVMLKKIPKPNGSKTEVFPEYGNMVDGFPQWVSGKDRRLMQEPTNETKFDLVVAKDGSGDFTTIGEAVAAAPNKSLERFVIYIKEGVYLENVEVVKKKTMLMFVGDGIEKTVVKADRNVVDGWTTFRSATVAVVGNGFIGKDMTFENSAGPSKHQAVALRSGSDLSAFYRCSFVGYQDTLYVHSLRQFYRECDIYGTVDFIFGNAAAVLQNCNLYARRPNTNQRNIYTAQGREDPNQNTGISIISSNVTAAEDLIPEKSSFRTYLGRPWKQYSRTVFIRSFIDDLVHPEGWMEWSGDFALATLYYGEYMNTGPGSNTSDRVTWPGYRVINSSTEAEQFTVEAFIQGNEWLSSTGVPLSLNLS